MTNLPEGNHVDPPRFAPKLIEIDPVVVSGGRFDDYLASETLHAVTAVQFDCTQCASDAVRKHGDLA